MGKLGDIWRRLRAGGRRGFRDQAPHADAPLPATFQVPRGGQTETVEVRTREELLKLRSELELMRLFAFGDSADALWLLERMAESGDPACAEMRDSLREARDPAVQAACESIDAHFPGVAGELCREVLEDEARAFRAGVLAALRASTIEGQLVVATSYALSADLGTATTAAAPAKTDSEVAMTKPNDANDAPQPSSNPAVDGAANAGLDAALDAMAGELKNLTDIVESEGKPDEAIADMLENGDGDPTPVAEVLEEQEKAGIEDIEAAVDELMIEDAPAAADADTTEDSAAEAVDRALADEARAALEAEDIQPQKIEPSPAPQPPPTASQKREDAPPALGLTPASPEMLDQPHPRQARRPIEPVASDDPADAEPVAYRPAPRPARERRPLPVRTTSPPMRGEVEKSLASLAHYLQSEAVALWEQTRSALEQAEADHEEVAEFHAQAGAMFEEMQRIRGEVAAARRESRMLQAQLQSLRDEAARAKQRADAAAFDAQSAADRAAAAAREAELSARFDRE